MLKKLIICILLCLIAGFIGSIFTTPSIPTWYQTLNKPSFNPPNWIFAPVWTTLYILMGAALAIVWQNMRRDKGSKVGIYLFIFQLIANVIWSYMFFTLHSPLYALINIAVLWILIIATILYFWKVSKLASILLWPYIAWVSFASFLNYSIFILNR